MRTIIITSIDGAIVPPTQRIFDPEVRARINVRRVQTNTALNGHEIDASIVPIAPSQAKLERNAQIINTAVSN